MSLKARDIAYQLAEHKIPVLSITEPTDALDGIIEITPKLQVQVSVLDDFLNVVYVTRDGQLDFGEVSESLEEIVSELRQHLPTPEAVTPA